ncbi:MAG: hypothetical protein QXQ64_06015 [Candidatus Bathyarchaeia archaeon]|nr:hypothetical protein [Candidatus Bathyarchaeota archaeon]
MKRILRKQKSTYIVGIFLCLLGITALIVALWKICPKFSTSQNLLSTFLSLLWTENINVGNLIELKLVYLVIFGDIALVFGFILWLLSRQWLIVPGKTVWYQCPFCKKRWKAVGDKALIHCPHCRQLVHPRIAEGEY